MTKHPRQIGAPRGVVEEGQRPAVLVLTRAQAARMVADGTLSAQDVAQAVRVNTLEVLAAEALGAENLLTEHEWQKARLLAPHTDPTKIFGNMGEDNLLPINEMLARYLTPDLKSPILGSERAGVKISRYMVSRGDDCYVNKPVNGDDPHMNRVPLVANDSIKLGFPLAQNFSSAERAMIEYFKGLSEKDFSFQQDPLVEMEIGVIQEGFQHVILRADCRRAFGTTYSFVLTTSRDPLFNNDLIQDHGTMSGLRRAEAERKEVQTSDPGFIRDCNIPPHYSARQPVDAKNGAAVYIAPFLPAVELNLTFQKDGYRGGVTRVVERNPINQVAGSSSIPLSPEQGSILMSRIAAVKLKYAILGKEAHLGIMRGGDFLLENGGDVETGKIWWHTHRNPSFAKAFTMRGGLGYYAEASKVRPDDMHVASYQTLQLLLDAEYCIRSGLNFGHTDADVLETLWPVYAVDEVVKALKISLDAGYLTHQDLERVITELCHHEVPDAIYTKEKLTARIREIVPKLQQIVAAVS